MKKRKKKKKRLIGRRKLADNYTEAADAYADAATVSAFEEEKLFSITSATGKGHWDWVGKYCRRREVTSSLTQKFKELSLPSFGV